MKDPVTVRLERVQETLEREKKRTTGQFPEIVKHDFKGAGEGRGWNEKNARQ